MANLRAKLPVDSLLSYQRGAVEAVCRDKRRFFLGIWSRQSGKSHMASYIAVALAYKFPGYQHIIAAPSERQSLAHLEKCKTWMEAFNVVLESEEIVYDDPGQKESVILAKSIRFSNGSVITAVPGRPETVRGFSGGISLDEFEFFDDQREVWRALVPTITNPLAGYFKPVVITTTPNGRDRKGYEIWRDNNGVPNSQWHCSMVDIYRATAAWEKERGMKQNLQELKDLLNDEDGWAQEFECKFIDNTSVLLPYDLIAKCESDLSSRELDFSILNSRESECYIGVDVGRKHDLTVIWILQKLGDVFWTRGIIELPRTDFAVQREVLWSILRAPSVRMCHMDETGLGMQLAEETEREFPGKVEKCMFTANFKNKIFTKMRTSFEDKSVRLPIYREAREDLHALQKTTSASGNVRFSASRNEDGHSDRATALALALDAASSDNGNFSAAPVRRPLVLRNKISQWRN